MSTDRMYLTFMVASVGILAFVSIMFLRFSDPNLIVAGLGLILVLGVFFALVRAIRGLGADPFRGTHACGTCGAGLVQSARYCGRCGDRLDARADR